MAENAPAWSAVAVPTLPRVLVAADGRELRDLPPNVSGAVFLRDLDLPTLVAVARSGRPPLGLEIESVDGLNPDAAAVRFVVEELGIRAILTRRAALAQRVIEAGGLALIHVFAFDSTGLTRSLDTHPGAPGAGTVISPGPVLAHLTDADLARLPRPVIAYGLIGSAELARTLLQRADAVMVRADCAAELFAAEF